MVIIHAVIMAHLAQAVLRFIHVVVDVLWRLATHPVWKTQRPLKIMGTIVCIVRRLLTLALNLDRVLTAVTAAFVENPCGLHLVTGSNLVIEVVQ